MRIVCCFLICCLLFNVSAAAAPSQPSQPFVAAHAAILMDAETGRVLWEKNAHKPLSMASTTKIMTAIMALEQGNLDDIVTVSKLAAAAPRVKMYLQPGEEISLGNLLYALLLQSSNDAAVAIAEHISGSVEGFCEAISSGHQDVST